MKALSLWQPWAWLVVHGGKDVENRTWRTNFRGDLLIHASSHRLTATERLEFLEFCTRQFGNEEGLEIHERARHHGIDLGGVLGFVEIVDCIPDSQSPWAMSNQWHWLVANPRPLAFHPWKGQRGLFEVDLQEMLRS